jgi:hypothetical protein
MKIYMRLHQQILLCKNSFPHEKQKNSVSVRFHITIICPVQPLLAEENFVQSSKRLSAFFVNSCGGVGSGALMKGNASFQH